MTEKAKQLYQIAEEKFNSINEELRTLNKDYHPIDEEYVAFLQQEHWPISIKKQYEKFIKECR